MCVPNKTQQWLIVISSVARPVETDSLYSDCYVNDIVKEGGGLREEEERGGWKEGEREGENGEREGDSEDE